MYQVKNSSWSSCRLFWNFGLGAFPCKIMIIVLWTVKCINGGQAYCLLTKLSKYWKYKWPMRRYQRKVSADVLYLCFATVLDCSILKVSSTRGFQVLVRVFACRWRRLNDSKEPLWIDFVWWEIYKGSSKVRELMSRLDDSDLRKYRRLEGFLLPRATIWDGLVWLLQT